MRDPVRIRPMLEVIARAWEHRPDLRLGQLLVNAHQLRLDEKPVGSMFYVEDGELMHGLAALEALRDRGPYR